MIPPQPFNVTATHPHWKALWRRNYPIQLLSSRAKEQYWNGKLAPASFILQRATPAPQRIRFHRNVMLHWTLWACATHPPSPQCFFHPPLFFLCVCSWFPLHSCQSRRNGKQMRERRLSIRARRLFQLQFPPATTPSLFFFSTSVFSWNITAITSSPVHDSLSLSLCAPRGWELLRAKEETADLLKISLSVWESAATVLCFCNSAAQSHISLWLHIFTPRE